MVTNDIIMQANYTLHILMVTKWAGLDLLSAKWWTEIGFVIFSYILSLTLIDKTRLTKTILFGSLISVLSVVVDTIGANSCLWMYSLPIFPMVPNIFLYDITAMPLYYMLIYQHAYSWKSYTIWNIGASAIMGFVFTPLLVSLGLLQLIRWNYVDTFLAITLIGFLAKAATSLIISFEDQSQAKQQISHPIPRIQPAMKPLTEQIHSDKGNKD